MAGGIGTREIATRYPVELGLIARTTKQTGRTMNLIPQAGSKVLSRNRKGIY